VVASKTHSTGTTENYFLSVRAYSESLYERAEATKVCSLFKPTSTISFELTTPACEYVDHKDTSEASGLVCR